MQPVEHYSRPHAYWVKTSFGIGMCHCVIMRFSYMADGAVCVRVVAKAEEATRKQAVGAALRRLRRVRDFQGLTYSPIVAYGVGDIKPPRKRARLSLVK